MIKVDRLGVVSIENKLLTNKHTCVEAMYNKKEKVH